MNRYAALIYGIACYAVFFVTFLYTPGFLGNLWVPKTVDSGTEGSIAIALTINFALLVMFALQHSVMARPGFKAAWTKFVPRPVERSTYVLFSTVAMVALFAFWQPITGSIWTVDARRAGIRGRRIRSIRDPRA